MAVCWKIFLWPLTYLGWKPYEATLYHRKKGEHMVSRIVSKDSQIWLHFPNRRCLHIPVYGENGWGDFVPTLNPRSHLFLSSWNITLHWAYRWGSNRPAFSYLTYMVMVSFTHGRKNRVMDNQNNCKYNIYKKIGVLKINTILDMKR